MNPINTAPRGIPVYVSNDSMPDVGEVLMSHDGRRWVGMAFTPMGPVRTTWDEENYPPPNRWRPAG
jgi:hypothetical protein